MEENGCIKKSMRSSLLKFDRKSALNSTARLPLPQESHKIRSFTSADPKIQGVKAKDPFQEQTHD